MWADGCDHDSQDGGVNHGGTGRHGVSCRSGGRGHDQAVTLNRRQVWSLAKPNRICVFLSMAALALLDGGTMKSTEMSLRCAIIGPLKRPFGCKKSLAVHKSYRKIVTIPEPR